MAHISTVVSRQQKNCLGNVTSVAFVTVLRKARLFCYPVKFLGEKLVKTELIVTKSAYIAVDRVKSFQNNCGSGKETPSFPKAENLKTISILRKKGRWEIATADPATLANSIQCTHLKRRIEQHKYLATGGSRGELHWQESLSQINRSERRQSECEERKRVSSLLGMTHTLQQKNMAPSDVATIHICGSYFTMVVSYLQERW